MAQAVFARGEEIKAVNPKSVGQILASRTIVACLVFLLISVIGSLIQKRLFTEKDTYKTCDFAVSKYSSLNYVPDVVLMGSSLMRLPFWLLDTAGGVNVPYEEYVESTGFLNTVRHSGVSINSVFNLGLDGAMVSDVYLLEEKLLTSTKKPKVVVYGIGPRDFMDTSFRAETRTPAFERLYTVEDVARDQFSLTPNPQDKLELIADRLFVLYSKRAQFQRQLEEKFATIIKPTPSPSTLAHKAETPWDKIIREYKGRYAQINEKQLLKQRQFLICLFNRMRQKDIKLTVVNMPLTRENRGLMPGGVYDDYLDSLNAACLQTNTLLIDLDKVELQNGRFFDSAHLNSLGAPFLAARLSQPIAAALSDDRRVVSLLPEIGPCEARR